ncbi:DUF6597 domain-containing transcriptional factor [Streptomyces sp. NPDC051018]|uniref:DUF6597 domain-containing transcriptional factor n=1 Tax=Streptomyces sp. NPDC051018 TaxID=3365639 RepID=UPI0037919218
MGRPRQDVRGIVAAGELMSRVRFRRREPAPELRPCLEHYWLIDWDLPEPYTSHVVPHPSVHIVFQQHRGERPWGEIAGIQPGLFAQRLEGRGRVCGVKFRPGGFAPFAPGTPVSDWTGHRVRLPDARLGPGGEGGGEDSGGGGRDEGARAAAAAAAAAADADTIVTPDSEDTRVAALDAFLLRLAPRPDPRALRAMELVDRVHADPSIRRVGELADAEGMSVRSLQRLFAAFVGVGPKWVILRHRIHDTLERAEPGAGEKSGGGAPDWAALAAELGYSDQAHLVRDFTATVGVPPAAYTTRAG